MFCSECGQKAQGKFCWSCGHALTISLAQDGGTVIRLESDQGRALVDWEDSLDCRAIVGVPEVRERIAAHASRAKKKFSGEDFLECCDSLFGTLTGGVPLTIIAKIAQPISERLGLKTGKQRVERVADRPGRVLVAVLCSLAQNGQQLRDVSQTPAGCTLKASLPSDFWSLKGDLLVTVSTDNSVTLLEAGTHIPGQIYDWGKSNRALEQLFADIRQLAKAA